MHIVYESIQNILSRTNQKEAPTDLKNQSGRMSHGMPAEQRQEIVSFVVLTRALRQMTTEQKRETARALFEQLSKE